jgi:outer membrane lipoprotein-sorting protein
MMKRLAVLVLSAVFLTGASAWAAPSQQVSSFSCDADAKVQGGISMNLKIMVKGNKFRLEGAMSGINSVTIYDGRLAYIYMPQQNMAMPVPIEQASREMIPSNWDIGSHCSSLGNEPADGEPCKLYDCKESKIWVSEATNFPVKVMAKNVEIHYRNFKQNVRLDDSLFALPAGANIMDLSKLMQGAGKR